MKTQNKYLIPLALVICLFFVWAISANLLPTMIRQLMKTCELTPFEASFTETAYWLAYFICPIPIAMFMKRYTYKAGIIFGLLMAAAGALMFFPAAELKEYWFYLCVFFVIATGMCFLETAANPYVTVLGNPATAHRRLNLAQSFNGLGAFISAMFISKIILSGHDFTRETLPDDFAGGWEGYIQYETDAMKGPYFALALLLIIIAVVFVFSKLPRINEEQTSQKGKLINFNVFKRPHLRNGVIAQFFYNGGQTAINSLFLVYCCTYAGIDGHHLLWHLYARIPSRAMDRHDAHGTLQGPEHAYCLCPFQCGTLRRRGRIRRHDRSLRHDCHIILHVHNISHTVLHGTDLSRP